MTNPAPTTARSDLERLADLPDLIMGQERQILGMKDAKAKAERKLKSVEAKVRLSEEVKSERNSQDRDAAFLLECENDADWTKSKDRLEELTRTIRSHEAQRDALRREREGLNTTLMLRAASRMEAVLNHKDFRAAVGAGILA